MGLITSINVGRGVDSDWASNGRTAIDKRPVAGPVAVHALGIDGDQQADRDHHGGVDQAVYAYAREDLDWWAERLGRQLRDGVFGENLTVCGIDVTGALLGERWRVGPVLLEVSAPRVPCKVFRGWMNEKGWVKRFTEAGRTGAYLRVLAEGAISAGEEIVVEHRPAESVSIIESFRAYHGDKDLMRRVLAAPGTGPQWQRIADRVLGAAG